MNKIVSSIGGKRFLELFEHLKNQPIPTSIPRLTELSDVDFRSQYAAKSFPFILKASNEDKGHMVLQRILEEFGQRIVKVRVGDYADPYHYAPERRQLIDITLSQYAEDLNRTKDPSALPPYAGNFSIPVSFLEQMDIGTPEYFKSNRYEPPTVWLGAKGSITPLHKDSTDNFARQLIGKKRWVIFPPQDAEYLALKHNPASIGGDFATSDIDLRNVDITRFPDFKCARPFEFVLNAGELLYVPTGWSHYVENLENSLMINYWLSTSPSGIFALDRT